MNLDKGILLIGKFAKKLLQRYFIDSSFLIFPQIIGTLVSLVTLPIILTNLPVADYGRFQLVLAMQVWLTALSGAHIASGSIRGIARGIDGSFLFAFLARLKLLVIAGLIGFGIAAYFYFINSYTFFYLLTILSIFLLTGYSFQSSYLQFLIAKKKFKQMAIWRITTSVVTPVISALVAYLTHNIVTFAGVQLGLTSLISCTAWVYVVRKNNLFSAYRRGKIDKQCVPYGLKLIPIDLISVTSAKISHFIIGPFFGFINLAVFSISTKLRDKFAELIRNVPSLLYSDFAQTDRNKVIKIINSRLKLLGVISIIFTFLFIGTGYFYIKLFLPKSYQLAIPYFVILGMAFPANMLAIVLHTLLESHLRYKELAIIGVIPNLFKIFLILLCGYFWGVIGICIGMTASGWLSFGFYYILTLKRKIVMELIKKYPLLEKLSNF